MTKVYGLGVLHQRDCLQGILDYLPYIEPRKALHGISIIIRSI